MAKQERRAQSIEELETALDALKEQELSLDEQIEDLDAELLKIDENLADIREKMYAQDCAPDQRERLMERESALKEMRVDAEESRELLFQQKQEITEQSQAVSKELSALRMQDVKRTGTSSRVGRVIAAPARYAASTAKRTAKAMLQKANPFDKNINQNDPSDHGIESLRLAYRSVKKVSGTTRAAAGTVKSAVKTTKATVNAVRKAPSVIVNTAKRTVKAAVKTVRITANIITHIIATLINPITWIILFFCVVIYVVLSIVVLIMGGANVLEGNRGTSYTQQVGIDDAALNGAREFYRIACERNKGNFASLINGLNYNNSDLQKSDLVYMERNAAGTVSQYTKGFPTDGWKNTLTSAWMISVSESEAIAIAYVYLEMQQNHAHGTEQQIYQIKYTQNVFNQIVDAAVQWSDTTHPHQACAGNNCSEHHGEHPNPAYQTALNDYNRCVARRDDFQAMVVPKATAYSSLLSQYNNTPAAGQNAMQPYLDAALAELVQAFHNWESVFGYTGWEINADIGINGSARLQQFVDSAWSTLQNIPQTITTTYWTCDHQHTLHSVGLYAYDKDAVMTALGFTNADRGWESLIELGMNQEAGGA